MYSQLETSFDQCLKCNACTVNCPISNVSLEFGGPKHLGPELQRLIVNQETISESRIELCTMCGYCHMACPENVHVSTLTAYAKALHADVAGTKFRDLVLSNAELVGKMASTFAPITNLSMKIKPVRKVMEWTMSIPAERQFPDYKFRSFTRKHKLTEAKTERKVAYFVGCYANYNAPEVGDAFVKVMKYNNIEVVTPKQKCCGIPMLTNGQMKQALKNAMFNVESLLDYTRRGYDVVVTCTSCTLALKKEYISFLKSEGAEELSKHVYDANEYLRVLKSEGRLNMNLAKMEEKAGYFAPCHMKAQGIGSPAMDILELIPDYEIQDVAAGCCGQCGTFGFKKEKFETSMAIGDKMAQSIHDVEADYTVTECGMCKNQLDQLTTRTVKHPIQVMAEAYEKQSETLSV